MADISFKAAYASVIEDEDEGYLFIGFAEGEDADESYVLFRQPLGGGPVWFELGDDAFGAEDALAAVGEGPNGLHITLRAEKAAVFGYAGSVQVGLTRCEDKDQALQALRQMLGPIWQEG